MRKLEKVVSIAVVTAVMATSMNVGNVHAAHYLETENVDGLVKPILNAQNERNLEITPSEPIQNALNEFLIEDQVLVKYLGEASDVVVPEGIIAIGSNAFASCSNLNSIKLPSSLISIY